MKQVKLLLVGIGGYGSFYMNELEKMADPSVILEGVCETVEGVENQYPMIQREGIPVYRSVSEFYKEHQADLAIICTPIHLHHPQTLECLSHGSNVLVEKPVCSTIQEAEDMAIHAEKAQKFVSVGYQMNYDPGILAMKRDILAGKFGKPLYFKAMHGFKRGRNYYHRNKWAGKILVNGRSVNDSPVNNSNAHQFQNMTFLLGSAMDRSAQISQVRAQLYRTDQEVENFDTAAICATTEEQVPIFYYTTHNCEKPEFGPASEFHFERGTIYLGKDDGHGPQMEYIVQMEGEIPYSYGPVPTAWSLKKLYDAIECAKQEAACDNHPVCTVWASTPHLQVVSQLASMPIHNVASEQVQMTKEE